MNNIVLIGMPGVGKSTTGIVLAKAIGYTFLDTDILIQNNENKLLQEIINNDGISKFLEIEERIILSNKYEKSVIATGGSAVLSNKIMTYLAQISLVIYLKLNIETIVERINNIKSRGIVLDKNQTLQDVYNIRTPLYEKYANIVIDCNEKRFEIIINEIIKSIQ
jgi:shikimate kinase